MITVSRFFRTSTELAVLSRTAIFSSLELGKKPRANCENLLGSVFWALVC